jgi:hypothetical protein
MSSPSLLHKLTLNAPFGLGCISADSMAIFGERHGCAVQCCHHVSGVCKQESALRGQCSDVPTLDSTVNASLIIHSPNAFKIQAIDAHTPPYPTENPDPESAILEIPRRRLNPKTTTRPPLMRVQ